MKVRLEIIDDDGTEITSAEFAGRNWKKHLLGILDMIKDETEGISEPSSYSSNSEVPVAESICQPQAVNVQHNAQQQAPQLQQSGQQTAPVQQYQQPVQQQQVLQPVPQQYQQPIQQAPVQQQYQQPVQQIQAPVMQPQYQQSYPQQPVIQNYQPPQYAQPNLPPVGLQQYGYGQPAQPMSAMVRQPVHPNQQTPSAVHHNNQQEQAVRCRTPKLQDRLNDMSLTINERLELFLKYEYPRVWFSSQDVQQHYERIYGTIKQSTVSTYLSRMYRKNLLERRGNRTQREYRYIADEPETTYMMEESSAAPVNNRFQY